MSKHINVLSKSINSNLEDIPDYLMEDALNKTESAIDKVKRDHLLKVRLFPMNFEFIDILMLFYHGIRLANVSSNKFIDNVNFCFLNCLNNKEQFGKLLKEININGLRLSYLGDDKLNNFLYKKILYLSTLNHKFKLRKTTSTKSYKHKLDQKKRDKLEKDNIDKQEIDNVVDTMLNKLRT